MTAIVEKRDAVLALLREFRDDLAGVQTHDDALRLVDRTRERLLSVQGADTERAYLARSLCQMATALRRRDYHQISRQLLEWGAERGALDSYTLVEIVQAHLRDADFAAAEATLVQARSRSLVSTAMYTALMSAYTRAGDWCRTQGLFDEAQKEGLANSHCYTALICAYGRAREFEHAERVCVDAIRTQQMDAGGYTALLDGYSKAGDACGAQRVFDRARAAGVATPALYTALLQVYAGQADLSRATHVFRRAEEQKILDDRLYRAMILANCEAGRWDDAERLLVAADVEGCLTSPLCAALIDAYGKARLLRKARRVFEKAVTRGLTGWDVHEAMRSANDICAEAGAHPSRVRRPACNAGTAKRHEWSHTIAMTPDR